MSLFQKKKDGARSRRASVIEAHDVFDRYHKHQELSASFEMDDEDESDPLDATQEPKKTSEAEATEHAPTRGRQSNTSFPQFHKGTYLLVRLYLIYCELLNSYFI